MTSDVENLEAGNNSLNDLDINQNKAINNVVVNFRCSPTIMAILRGEERKRQLLEKTLDTSAQIFHVGESILRNFPEDTGEQIAQKIFDHFAVQNIVLSGTQKEIIKMSANALEKAKSLRQQQIQEIFQVTDVSIPHSLNEVEKILNSNPLIQFHEWKKYSLARGGEEYLNTVLYRDIDKTRIFAKQEGIGDDIMHFSQEQKEKIGWLLEGGVECIKFDITSHPPSIIYQVKEINSYMEGLAGYFNGSNGKIYISGGKNIVDIQQSIEHEYQHFLNKYFVQPIFLNNINSYSDDIVKSFARWGILDETLEELIQWQLVKNEIASYLERDGILPPLELGYIPYLPGNSRDLRDRIRINFEKIYSVMDIIRDLIQKGIDTQEIVDIVRTSAGFAHATLRFRYRYKSIMDLPSKDANLLQIIELINKNKAVLLSDGNSFWKESGYIIAESKYRINDTTLVLKESIENINNKTLEQFISSTCNKKNFLNNRTQEMLSQLGEFDEKEVIETLEYITQNFGSVVVYGSTEVGSSWYIDRSLILHTGETNRYDLKDPYYLGIIFFGK